jgi:hypothetical protein
MYLSLWEGNWDSCMSWAIFICLLLVSKRNRMMNSPLHCRKNWGLPSSIHWSHTSIRNLPFPSWIQNIFKSGLFSSQRNRCPVIPILSLVIYRYLTRCTFRRSINFWKNMEIIILSGAAWILMVFFSNWFGWHTSNSGFIYELSRMHEFKTMRIVF